jgi:hypothetical protein
MKRMISRLLGTAVCLCCLWSVFPAVTAASGFQVGLDRITVNGTEVEAFSTLTENPVGSEIVQGKAVSFDADLEEIPLEKFDVYGLPDWVHKDATILVPRDWVLKDVKLGANGSVAITFQSNDTTGHYLTFQHTSASFGFSMIKASRLFPKAREDCKKYEFPAETEETLPKYQTQKNFLSDRVIAYKEPHYDVDVCEGVAFYDTNSYPMYWQAEMEVYGNDKALIRPILNRFLAVFQREERIEK